jgi:hypothetical protein
LKKTLFEPVVMKWAKFWRWQSKMIEKKWQERNYAVQKKISYVI